MLLAALLFWPTLSMAEPEGRIGILVVAHGGTNRWNSAVRKAVKQASLEAPTEVALGMGMHPEEVRQLQQTVNRLQRKGIARIAVVPLFVSSHSEVFRQYEYLFGLRDKPEWSHAGGPLELRVPIVVGKPLDADPLLADVLLERAKSLSRTPERETVILVAHGPNQESDNQEWVDQMHKNAESIKRRGGFHEALVFTMRDDAEAPIKQQAEQALREAVAEAGRQGRALVVPVLIAQGGVEQKIPKILAGLSYGYNGQTLLPHPKLVEWIAKQANELSASAPR
ncbi:MAG: hypothetical protein HYZ92_01945 [Candidatus Omnitrophica bacterium]|nr:hypothetical protein [Candidatus Omnitrophota bacterium]